MRHEKGHHHDALFEDKVKRIEDDIAENRSKLHALIESLKVLSKTNEKVAEVLKRFNLL